MQYYQKTKNGYVYDKRIFFGSFLVCCLIAVYIFYQFNFDFSKKIYVECNSPTCENSMVNNPDCKEEWCKQKTLTWGTYGEPPPESWLFNNFGKLAFFIMLFGLGLNHIIHNRNNKFEFLTPKLPKWFHKFFGENSRIGKFLSNLEDE